MGLLLSSTIGGKIEDAANKTFGKENVEWAKEKIEDIQYKGKEFANKAEATTKEAFKAAQNAGEGPYATSYIKDKPSTWKVAEEAKENLQHKAAEAKDMAADAKDTLASKAQDAKEMAADAKDALASKAKDAKEMASGAYEAAKEKAPRCENFLFFIFPFFTSPSSFFTPPSSFFTPLSLPLSLISLSFSVWSLLRLVRKLW